jgi:predicted NUDIX family NTP pyrophosphohydrolase
VKHSAGLLLYRRGAAGIEVLLVHPGGPFWARRDEHACSVPKGEFGPDDDPITAARREFAEETGFLPDGELIDLGIQKRSGKTIHLWAVEGDCDPAAVRSNSFTIEWPPRSGQVRSFPEADRAAWFDLATAQRKIHKNQLAFLQTLQLNLPS